MLGVEVMQYLKGHMLPIPKLNEKHLSLPFLHIARGINLVSVLQISGF